MGSRVRALRLWGVVAVALAVGCSSSTNPPDGGPAQGDSGPPPVDSGGHDAGGVTDGSSPSRDATSDTAPGTDAQAPKDAQTATDTGPANDGSPSGDAALNDAAPGSDGAADGGNWDANAADGGATDAPSGSDAGSDAPLSADTGASDGAAAMEASIVAPAPAQASTATVTKSVSKAVPAGVDAVLLHADNGFSVVDLQLPTNAVTYGPFSTVGAVQAATFDEQRSLLYYVDSSGAVGIYNLPTASQAAALTSASLPAGTAAATGIARVGNELFVLAGATIVPFSIHFQGTVPYGLTALPSIALAQAGSQIAAGASMLYVGYAGGKVEAWPIDTNVADLTDAGSYPAATSAAGSYATGGTLVSLIAKGSKVFTLGTGVGLTGVDFGTVATPALITSFAGVSDPLDAHLFGKTLVVSLSRGATTALDLSDYAHPRAVATDTSGVPGYFTVVGGNVVLGSGTTVSILAVPPVVSGGFGAVVQNAVPTNGTIPVSFSKPIDPASVSSSTVSLDCGGSTVTGTTAVAANRLSLFFTPSSPLPASTACTLSLNGVTDLAGISMTESAAADHARSRFMVAQTGGADAGGVGYAFTTADAGVSVQSSPTSGNGHTVDGLFTGYGTDAGGPFEWSDIWPTKGMYTYFYADFDGKYLWVMNDWFQSDEIIDPDCYNSFGFLIAEDQWTIRAYGDQHVETYRNGSIVEPAAAGVLGASGFGPSPNLQTPHAMWELRIPATAGNFTAQLSDPHSGSSCSNPYPEPTSPGGSLDGGVSSGPSSVPAPAIPTSPVPSDTVTGVSLSPTLSWSEAGNYPYEFALELSLTTDFSQPVKRAVLTGKEAVLPFGILQGDTTYYWRVTAFTASSTSPTPSVWSFTTATAPPPGDFELLTNVVGAGSITSADSTINCGDSNTACSSAFVAASTVTLTATADSGWSFSGWSGSCAGGASSVPVRMVTNLACTATFYKTDILTLSINPPGAGSVTATPSPVTCDASVCMGPYSGGTIVYLTPVPAAGYAFSSVTGACVGIGSFGIVSMSSDETCTVNFSTSEELIVAAYAGGTVSSSPPGITDCSSDAGVCRATFSGGEAVTLTPTPAANYVFTGWSGSCTNSDAGTATVIDVTAQETCYAAFALASTLYTLDVVGIGGGTVTSVPPGILNCTADAGTCEAGFTFGTDIALRVTLESGYTLLSWEGSLAGCTGTNTTVNIVMGGEMETCLPNMIPCGAATEACCNTGPACNTGLACEFGEECVAVASGTMATGQTYPAQLAVDSNYVYWNDYTDGGAIMRAPLDGGAAAPMASSPHTPTSLAVDSLNVYWTDPAAGDIFAVPLDGGPAVTLVSGLSTPSYITAYQNELYVSTENAATVLKIPTSGSSVSTFSSGYGATGLIAAAGGNVCWASTSHIVCSTPTGTPSPAATTTGTPQGVTTDGTHVYWTEGSPNSVQMATIGNGGPAILADAGTLLGYDPLFIASDSNYAYVTGYQTVDGGILGAVFQIPFDGGALSTILAPTAMTLPYGIAVDTTSVYWAEYLPGNIDRAAK